MAYGIKYQFTFQAQNGDTFYIIVEKDGYSGSVIKRCLGGAPIFRRERNGHVCGSSLEFLAECTTDGEFSEFYTSNPKLFRVSLTSNSGTHFRGFISPELYSEPDIAPPYDVKVTATDGLGELRRYLYEAQGLQTIGDLLEYLLSFTGLATGFNSNNATLVGEQDENVPAADFFDSTYINLDHMAGKSCYDVLTRLLDSIHADLFQRITTGTPQWQILRETDVENASQIVCSRSKVDPFYDTKVAATPFGSMRSYDWWPVGQLESEVKPACKRMVVKTDANYGEGLVNADMTSDTGWTKSNATYNSTQQAYQINAQNGYIFQTLSFTEGVRKRLTLKIRMRQYKSSQSGTGTESTAKVTVSMYGRTTGTLRNLYLREDTVDGHLYWSDQSGSFSVDLPAPVYGETETACTVFEVEVPLYSDGGRNFAIANSISVQIARDSSSYPLLVHSCSLTMAERIAGYEDLFTFSNGARDEAPDVNSLFLPAVQGYYSTPVEFMYGVPKIISSGSYVATNLFDPVGLDYAKSNGIVRLYKRGRLNVPSGAVVPFAFIDSDSDVYLIRSFEWDPLNCEMQVELLSLPAASVSIASQEVTEMSSASGTASGSSGSSSGGGGGSSVSWDQIQPDGKKIAEITIDGTVQSVYAPELSQDDLISILGFYKEIGDTAEVMSHGGEPYYRRFGLPEIGGNVSDYFESFYYARMYVVDISQYQGLGAIYLLKCFDQPVTKANYVVADANDIVLAYELGTDYATIRDFKFYSEQYPTAARIYIVYDASQFPDYGVVVYKKGVASVVEKLNGNVTRDNLYSLQGAREWKLSEDIDIDLGSCTLIDGKKCIVLPDGCTFDFNDYQLKNSTDQDVYLYSNDMVYLTCKDTQKNMMPAIGFVGKFSFLKPVRLSNLYAGVSTYREYSMFRESLSAFYASEIIIDYEMGTPVVTDATTVIHDITLRDGGGKFFVSALLQCTGNTRLIGLTIENLYPGYGIELGGNCLVKDCTLTGPIKTTSDRNVIRGCSITLDGLKIESSENVVEDNDITVQANNVNYKGIVIQQSRNVIRRNLVSNGLVGIQMAFFNQHAKEISGNVIEGNEVSGQMEEAIAMDESGMRKMNRGQFIGFVSASDPLNIIIDFEETISDISEYIGFPIFGISDATMGLVSHIAGIEQYSGTQYKVTLADRIFQPYYQNGSATYVLYDATAAQQGYKDFRNSMFGVASVFWGNVIRNNIVHRDSICLYGGGFYNVIQDNVVYSDTYIAVYLITTAKNKYMDNVGILPVCGNVVTGNIVLNGGVYTEMGPNLYDYQPSSLDSRISTKYIAHNYIAGNVSRVAYFEDFNSVIDTALVMESMVDTVPNKQTVDTSNNKAPLYFIDDGQLDKLLGNRGIRALIRNSNGTYKVYAGRASGTYNQTKQFDNL